MKLYDFCLSIAYIANLRHFYIESLPTLWLKNKLEVRMRMMPPLCRTPVHIHFAHAGGAGRCQKLCAAGLVGAQRTIPGLWRLSNTCFLLLNSFLFSFCSLYGGLTSLLFCLRASSRLLCSALVSALDSAKYVRCEGPAVQSYPSSIGIKRRPPTSVLHQRPDRVMWYNHTCIDAQVPERDRKLTFLSVTASFVRTTRTSKE